jgi:uncharacterized protein (DUF2252 family)
MNNQAAGAKLIHAGDKVMNAAHMMYAEQTNDRDGNAVRVHMPGVIVTLRHGEAREFWQKLILECISQEKSE